MKNVQIDGIGMEITSAIKDYIRKRCSKLDTFSEQIISVKARCKEMKSSRGIAKDFKLEITVIVPNSLIRVEKSGSDIYVLIDEIIKVVIRKLKRYKDIANKYPDISLPDNYYKNIEFAGDDSHYSYVPKISKRKKLVSKSTMSEAEAIERMELAGLSFYLFRNLVTKIWSVVYKRADGTYGIIESL